MVLSYPMMMDTPEFRALFAHQNTALIALTIAAILLLITVGNRAGSLLRWVEGRKTSEVAPESPNPNVDPGSAEAKPRFFSKESLVSPGALFLLLIFALFVRAVIEPKAPDSFSLALICYFFVYIPYWWLIRCPVTWIRWNYLVLKKARTHTWAAVMTTLLSWPLAAGIGYLTVVTVTADVDEQGAREWNEWVSEASHKWAVILDKVRDTRATKELSRAVHEALSPTSSGDFQVSGISAKNSGHSVTQLAIGDPIRCPGGIGVQACMECLNPHTQEKVLKARGYRIPDDEFLGLAVDALIDVCVKYGDDTSRQNLEATFSKTATNKVLDYLKTGSRRFLHCEFTEEVDHRACWQDQDPTDYMQYKREERIVHGLLCELDENEIGALLHRVVLDWDYAEIAVKFGLTLNQAKDLTNNTIKKLKARANMKKCRRTLN